MRLTAVVLAGFTLWHLSHGVPKLNSSKLRNQLAPQDVTPTVIAEVVEKYGGGRTGPCQLLLYFDQKTVSNEQLRQLQAVLGSPIMLLDVTNIRLGLITAQRGPPVMPKVDLLTNRPEKETCRVLLSWSEAGHQRGLLVLAKLLPDIVRQEDTLILTTEYKNIGSFIPELNRRIVVRKNETPGKNASQVRFVVEQSCLSCGYSPAMEKIGELGEYAGLTWKRRSKNPSLLGKKIRVTYTPSVPNIYTTSEGVLDGLEYRMLQYAAEALNFTYVLQIPADNEWGRFINGSWTGKVGDLVNNRSDLAIGGIVYKSQRSAVALYSTMFHQELWSIVCPRPTKLPLWPYIMFPFRSEKAPSVFTFLVLLHIVAFIIASFASSVKQRNRQNDTPFMKSVKNIFLVAGSFYWRIMACLYFWNLFYCILEPQYEEPINSSIALLDSAKKYGLVRGTTVETVLASSLDASQQKLARDARRLSSISEGFFNLDTNGMCIVGVPKRYAESTIRTRYTTQCGEPAIQVSSENLHTVLGGWLMASKSPLKEKLDPIIVRLQSFGFLNKWQADLYDSLSRSRDEKLPCVVQPVGSLSFYDLRLAFLLLLVGWGAALVLLGAEYAANYFIQKLEDEFGPMHGDHNTSMNYRRAHTQRTWAERVLRQIAPHRQQIRRPIATDAELRRRMYMFFKEMTEPDFLHPQVTIRPPRVAEARSLPHSKSQTVIVHHQAPNSVSKKTYPIQPTSAHASAAARRAPLDVVSKQATSITEVRPYEIPLSRAARVPPLQRNYSSRKTSRRKRLRLPNIPNSPVNALPRLRDPLVRFFSAKQRVQNLIPRDSDGGDSSARLKSSLHLTRKRLLHHSASRNEKSMDLVSPSDPEQREINNDKEDSIDDI
ncbi:Ionotropic receptor 126 [Hyalella azteca]|uniref:Ionotropic receptor 126 n=1 Tax=Hyalella azteca TaxID=294128 RepID=A0A6A0H5N1_HYAAZ|nr:uncharacterized protein LOC108680948 [Hyalella azteca]KAA0198571.1 Ionotropic receptor 126 [Hyalella azteca]